MDYFEKATLDFLKSYQPLKIATKDMIEELKSGTADKDRINYLGYAIKRNAQKIKYADMIFSNIPDGANTLKRLYAKRQNGEFVIKDDIDINKLTNRTKKLLGRLSILLFGAYGMGCFDSDNAFIDF